MRPQLETLVETVVCPLHTEVGGLGILTITGELQAGLDFEQAGLDSSGDAEATIRAALAEQTG